MGSKVAIITDIHGNHSALKAVLNEIDQDNNIEHILCTGDLIGIGHETNEVLEELFSREDVSYVKGNHDEAILDILNGKEPYSKGNERIHHKWIASKLDPQFLPKLSSLPPKMKIQVNGLEIQLQHYHLDEQEKCLSIDHRPTTDKLDELYRGSTASIICFGHHHFIHHFKSYERLYLNPSSLGCNPKPLAPYAQLYIGDSGEVTVSFHEVPYDNKEFLLAYEKKEVPDREYILKGFHGNQQLKYK